MLFANSVSPHQWAAIFCILFRDVCVSGMKEKIRKRIFASGCRYPGNPRIDTEHVLVSQVGYFHICTTFGILKFKRAIDGKYEECNTNGLNMLVVLMHERRYLRSRAVLKKKLKKF